MRQKENPSSSRSAVMKEVNDDLDKDKIEDDCDSHRSRLNQSCTKSKQ